MSSIVPFGNGSFRRELWIRNKEFFLRPEGVDVEFASAGPFDWIVADHTGKVVQSIRRPNAHGGWTSIHFLSLGLMSSYSIGFRNTFGNEIKIKQGEVRLY